jgi:hypothetical protein
VQYAFMHSTFDLNFGPSVCETLACLLPCSPQAVACDCRDPPGLTAFLGVNCGDHLIHFIGGGGGGGLALVIFDNFDKHTL